MKVISPGQFVEKINEKIKTIYGYTQGMEIFLTPDNERPTGYTWDQKWNGSGIESVVSAASHEILKEHKVDVSLPPILPF